MEISQYNVSNNLKKVLLISIKSFILIYYPYAPRGSSYRNNITSAKHFITKSNLHSLLIDKDTKQCTKTASSTTIELNPIHVVCESLQCKLSSSVTRVHINKADEKYYNYKIPINVLVITLRGDSSIDLGIVGYKVRELYLTTREKRFIPNIEDLVKFVNLEKYHGLLQNIEDINRLKKLTFIRVIIDECNLTKIKENKQTYFMELCIPPIEHVTEFVLENLGIYKKKNIEIVVNGLNNINKLDKLVIIDLLYQFTTVNFAVVCPYLHLYCKINGLIFTDRIRSFYDMGNENYQNIPGVIFNNMTHAIVDLALMPHNSMGPPNLCNSNNIKNLFLRFRTNSSMYPEEYPLPENLEYLEIVIYIEYDDILYLNYSMCKNLKYLSYHGIGGCLNQVQYMTDLVVIWVDIFVNDMIEKDRYNLMDLMLPPNLRILITSLHPLQFKNFNDIDLHVIISECENLNDTMELLTNTEAIPLYNGTYAYYIREPDEDDLRYMQEFMEYVKYPMPEIYHLCQHERWCST